MKEIVVPNLPKDIGKGTDAEECALKYDKIAAEAYRCGDVDAHALAMEMAEACRRIDWGTC